MSTWLHIGSSPTVTRTLPCVMAEWQFDKVITCNAGIKLYPVPDVYVAIDGIASVNYEQQARHAQENGATLVTLYRACEKARHDRKVDHYDEQIEINPHNKDKFTGTDYTQFRFTGPFCLQYAVLHGATTVVIVGCDGWTGRHDYFDEADGHVVQQDGDLLEKCTKRRLVPAFRSLAENSPDVRFVQYGFPLYEIGFPNWEVRK